MNQRVGVDQLDRSGNRQERNRIRIQERAVASVSTGRTRLPPASNE